MKIAELAEQCVQQIDLVGNDAKICLVLPGKGSKSGKKRLCPGGPVGEINGEAMGAVTPSVIVFFGAMDVLAFLAARGLVAVSASVEAV